MLTYKDNSGDYSAPTEIIPINNCCTVKSADDELNIKNSFVSPILIFWQIKKFLLISLFFIFSQKVLVSDRTFYFMGSDNSDKEAWIGALGKAMIKTSVMIEDNMEGVYM